MPLNTGLYEALGLEPGASEEEIRRAYRKKAQKAHPDKAGGSRESFELIQKARDVLGDKERRARYDSTGETQNNEPSIRDIATQSIAEVMVELINAQNDSTIGYIDLIAEARKKVREGQKNMEKMKPDLLARAKLFRKAAKRLRRKKNGENIIAGMLERQADSLAEGAVKADRTLAMIAEVFVILNEYECTPPSGEDMEEYLRASTHAQFANIVFGLGNSKGRGAI